MLLAKQKHIFLFVQGMMKQSLALVSEISRMIKVSVRIIWLSLWLRLITLIILYITKTSSSRCLLFVIRRLKTTSHSHQWLSNLDTNVQLVMLQ